MGLAPLRAWAAPRYPTPVSGLPPPTSCLVPCLSSAAIGWRVVLPGPSLETEEHLQADILPAAARILPQPPLFGLPLPSSLHTPSLPPASRTE